MTKKSVKRQVLYRITDQVYNLTDQLMESRTRIKIYVQIGDRVKKQVEWELEEQIEVHND